MWRGSSPDAIFPRSGLAVDVAAASVVLCCHPSGPHVLEPAAGRGHRTRGFPVFLGAGPYPHRHRMSKMKQTPAAVLPPLAEPLDQSSAT